MERSDFNTILDRLVEDTSIRRRKKLAALLNDTEYGKYLSKNDKAYLIIPHADSEDSSKELYTPLTDRQRLSSKYSEARYLFDIDESYPPSPPVQSGSVVPVSELLKHKFSLEWVVGVYFLFKGDDVVYVGQSVNVFSRVASHKSGSKDFDGFTYVQCDKRHLDFLESLYIHALRPRLNGSVGGTYKAKDGRKTAPFNLLQVLDYKVGDVPSYRR